MSSGGRGQGPMRTVLIQSQSIIVVISDRGMKDRGVRLRSQRGVAIDYLVAGAPGAWANRAGPMGSAFACTVFPPRTLCLKPSAFRLASTVPGA